MAVIARDHLDGGGCFTLERMVVLPEHQGRGLGSRCLGVALETASSAGLPTLLSTQLEVNVRFYGKLGFEVVHTAEYLSPLPSFRFPWFLRVSHFEASPSRAPSTIGNTRPQLTVSWANPRAYSLFQAIHTFHLSPRPHP